MKIKVLKEINGKIVTVYTDDIEEKKRLDAELKENRAAAMNGSDIENK